MKTVIFAIALLVLLAGCKETVDIGNSEPIPVRIVQDDTKDCG